MDLPLLLAGLLTALLAVGHLAGGLPYVLRPMLESSTPPMPRVVHHSTFHWVTILLFAAAGLYLVVGGGMLAESYDMTGFVSVGFLLFAVCQLVIALRSELERAWLQVWQWMVFAVIGALGLWGSVG